MFFIILFLSLTLTNKDQLFEVDCVEINQTESVMIFGNKPFKQILLWRWTPSNNPEQPSGFRIAQWWAIELEPTVYRKNNGWVIRSKNISIFTKSFRRTKTSFDPEHLDRQFLKEELRIPYFAQPLYLDP